MSVFSTTPKIIFGTGSTISLLDEIKSLQAKRVTLVISRTILKNQKIIELIGEIKSYCELEIISDIEPDPSLETAEGLGRKVKAFKPDLMVGIGGGSVLDITKIGSVMATNPGNVSDILGVDNITTKGIPMILVPTTAGTGSEVTPISILTDHKERLKKGIVSNLIYPDIAVLDPQLTVSLPPLHTAATGMDALIHAMEAYTSNKANEITDMLAKEAIKLISGALVGVFRDGENLELRKDMLRGSMLAGMAFGNAGVTAVHAFAYPIGAEFDVPHGIANSLMLLPVFSFNYHYNSERFDEIATIISDSKNLFLWSVLKDMITALNLPTSLSDYGVKESAVEHLAESALKVTRLLANNCREFTLIDAMDMYQQVL